MGRLWPRTLVWLVFVLLAAVGGGLALAALTWLVQRPEAFWPRLASYWLSRASLPFWISAAGLNLASALLVPGLAWRPRRRELKAVPAATFLATLAYALLRFARHALGGVPFLGQVAAFWPEALMLAASLATGSFLALLALRWALAPAACAGPVLHHPSHPDVPPPGGNPASLGEPRDARSVRRGRIRGHRPGDHRPGPGPRRHP